MQEFDFEIYDKKGSKNLVFDHLSQIIVDRKEPPLHDTFLDEHLFSLKNQTPWYANIVNYLVTSEFPSDFSRAQKNKLRHDSQFHVWDNLYLWKHCFDQIIRRCIPSCEIESILEFCHSHAYGGHFGPKRTVQKVLDVDFSGPLCFTMHICFVSHVIDAREWEI